MSQSCKTCKTCKWAVWQLSLRGNPLRKQPGRCTYKIDWPKIPQILEGFTMPNPEFYGIWQDDSYGDHCQCYEKYETKIRKAKG